MHQTSASQIIHGNQKDKIFEMLDEDLYQEMLNHPKALTILSRAPDQKGNDKQFKYLYVDDRDYMLGQGSFGKVFVCFHQSTDRIVKLALKIIKIPQAYEQIKTIQHIVSTSRQQILALIKLRKNKHIIRIQDIIRNNNTIYIMLQFCNEKDLISFWNKIRFIFQGKTNGQLIVRYFFSMILDAFKELNKWNFMHRDIKPSNILVKNGILKVADFGLARQIVEGQRQKFQQHVGTMITAAPQIVFRQQYTNKCDIYSLGVILYWMIYEKFPFQKIPTREDFLQNKLRIPEKCQYFQVSLQMQKLLKQMLAYNQIDRINWIPLLQHPLFDENSFIDLDKQIRSHYDGLQLLKNRQTYGRNFVTHVSSDDQFLQTTVPTSYYKFLRQIQGQEKYNRCLVQERNSFKQNKSLYAHKIIKDQYKNQDIKIKFYRIILLELESIDFQKTFKKNKQEVSLIRSLLQYSIQKYLIYLMVKIKDELIFTIPPSIFQIGYLKQAESDPLHRNFVQTIIEKVKGNQFTSKLGPQDIKKLELKCQQFKINSEMAGLFDEINESNTTQYLQLIDQCIIQMIYFIKDELTKLTSVLSKSTVTDKSTASSFTKNGIFRSLILLCHHLFMFSMQDQVFPAHYNNQFSYSSFIDAEQFKIDKNMRALAQHILYLLARFQ